MFLQRFTCCLPHSLGCLLPACHDRQFRHQIVFLLHTIQHIHASQMHMISQIKCVFTKIYFNRFPKGGTSRRPFNIFIDHFLSISRDEWQWTWCDEHIRWAVRSTIDPQYIIHEFSPLFIHWLCAYMSASIDCTLDCHAGSTLSSCSVLQLLLGKRDRGRAATTRGLTISNRRSWKHPKRSARLDLFLRLDLRKCNSSALRVDSVVQ